MTSLYADPSDIPSVIHTKLPASVRILRVVSSAGHVIPPHFFPQGLGVNAARYIEVLVTGQRT